MKNRPTIVTVSPRFLQRPQKAKSREPAYSRALNQKNSIDRESDVYGLWCLEFREGGMGKRMDQDMIC